MHKNKLKFMKALLKIVYFLFVGILSIHAQTNSISGKITSNGEALPFANIYLANTKLGSASNEKGFFELKNIPNGNYTLISSSVGFDLKSIKIILTGDQKIVKNFNLNENNSLEEIVISGTLRPISKSNSPVSVEVYSTTFFKKKSNPFYF